MSGKLYLCGTPIGNLEDITFRVLETLKSCDVVYAEDTRHSIRLLNHFGISKPLHSYHDHNQEQAGNEIISKVQKGEKVALITDAGMPGISDPGENLVVKCIESDTPFEIIPGVTAFSMALVGSGFSTGQFVFEGFLSRDKRQKRKHIERLKYERRTLLFYESPHRLKETLRLLFEGLGDRKAVVARELTKKFETFQRGNLSELMEFYDSGTIKGEIVIVLEGSETDAEPVFDFSEIPIKERYESLMEGGLDNKEAMKVIAKERNMKKSDVYSLLLE
ncbi:MAG: 16S rRNA (cytidine(1402)-2'-O)-methyltransferase [Clostridiales bacterium]|nr:16S rRNA (cytidine(1402)-2'-O)-methyltransferase [Clostridiales bacterium]